MTTKSYVEYLNRKGGFCYVCGQEAFSGSKVYEADGHVRHCTCEPTMHLQGIGEVAAIPAEQIKAGMTITWNYGTQSTVVSAQQHGKRSMQVVEEINGTRYTRLFRRERLVAARVR